MLYQNNFCCCCFLVVVFFVLFVVVFFLLFFAFAKQCCKNLRSVRVFVLMEPFGKKIPYRQFFFFCLFVCLAISEELKICTHRAI